MQIILLALLLLFVVVLETKKNRPMQRRVDTFRPALKVVHEDDSSNAPRNFSSFIKDRKNNLNDLNYPFASPYPEQNIPGDEQNIVVPMENNPSYHDVVTDHQMHRGRSSHLSLNRRIGQASEFMKQEIKNLVESKAGGTAFRDETYPTQNPYEHIDDEHEDDMSIHDALIHPYMMECLKD